MYSLSGISLVKFNYKKDKIMPLGPTNTLSNNMNKKKHSQIFYKQHFKLNINKEIKKIEKQDNLGNNIDIIG